MSPTLSDVISFVYDPAVTVKLGILPLRNSGDTCPNVEDFLRMLYRIERRVAVGDEARELVLDHCGLYPKQYHEMLLAIFLQTLDLGLSLDEINKALPQPISAFKVAELLLYKGGVSASPFWITPIPRGARVVCFAGNNSATILTPQGDEVVGSPHINSLLRKLPHGVYDGYLVTDELHIMDYIVDWELPRVLLLDRIARLKTIRRSQSSPEWTLLDLHKCTRTTELLREHSDNISNDYLGTAVRSNSYYVKGKSETLMSYFS